MSPLHNKGYLCVETEEGDTKHRTTVEPINVEKDRKSTLHALHTDAVNEAVKCNHRNVVLYGRPPPISDSKKKKNPGRNSQLGYGYCWLLDSYKGIIKNDAGLNLCAECCKTPRDVKHLSVCPAHPLTIIPSDLWSRPVDAVRELGYLEARDPDLMNMD